mgnify:CR=1 FL=1
MNKKNIGQKILHFPLTKIIIGFIVCGVIIGVGQTLIQKALELTSIDKDFKNKNVAIDASVEIYRAALGMQKLDTLTDSYGNPTGHINVILLNILKLKANNANQYWIFDYNDSENKDKDICHNPLKQLELQKRKEKRMGINTLTQAI